MSLIVLWVAGTVVGDWVLRPFGIKGGIEALAYRLFVGLWVCAIIILIIGSRSLATAQLAINAIAAVGFGYELFVQSRRSGSQTALPSLRPSFDYLEWASLAGIASALVMTFVSALAPATGWDACVAHLALPMDYVRDGRIHLLEGNEYSAYPHLVHCLFAYAFYQGGETGVMLVSWGFAGLACVAAHALGRRIESRRCAILAAGILATAPIFFDQGGTASVDLAFCAYTLAALACLAAWRDERQLSWLILGALLAGASCGIRHTGYLVCALLAFGAVLISYPDRTLAAGYFCTAALVGALPWLLRSFVLAGNPFYPLLADYFGSGAAPHWEVIALGTHSSIHGTGLRDLALFPWNIIMRPHWFDGWTKSPGGLVLFLGIPGLIVGGRRARMLGAFSGAGMLAFFCFQRLARYLLPFFAPMMVVAAMAACRLKTLRYIAAFAILAALLYGLALDAAAVHFKIPVVLGLQTRDNYLMERVERYPAFAWINEHIPPEDTILTFDRRTYYIQCRTFQNDEPIRRIRDLPVEEQARWLREHDIKWVLVPLTYIEESPGHRASFFSMVNAWRRADRYFKQVRSFNLPRPRASGTEVVEIYEVLQE